MRVTQNQGSSPTPENCPPWAVKKVDETEQYVILNDWTPQI